MRKILMLAALVALAGCKENEPAHYFTQRGESLHAVFSDKGNLCILGGGPAGSFVLSLKPGKDPKRVTGPDVASRSKDICGNH